MSAGPPGRAARSGLGPRLGRRADSGRAAVPRASESRIPVRRASRPYVYGVHTPYVHGAYPTSYIPYEHGVYINAYPTQCLSHTRPTHTFCIWFIYTSYVYGFICLSHAIYTVCMRCIHKRLSRTSYACLLCMSYCILCISYCMSHTHNICVTHTRTQYNRCVCVCARSRTLVHPAAPPGD